MNWLFSDRRASCRGCIGLKVTLRCFACRDCDCYQAEPAPETVREAAERMCREALEEES